MTPFKAFRSTVCAVFVFVSASATAQPVIADSFAFTERQGATSLWESSHSFVVGSTSIVPSGVGTSASATHVPGGGPDYGLNFVPAPLSSSQFQNQYAFRTAYTGQTGQWDIAATDAGGTTVLRTHVLDDVRDLPLITGLTVSGSALTPHLTWNAVDATLFPSFCGGSAGPCALGTDVFHYRVEVRTITGAPEGSAPLSFLSPNMWTSGPTMFDIPVGVLSLDNHYIFGVQLTHGDLEMLLPGGGLLFRLENRSTAYVEITTAIPEPETYAMLLAGLGLLGFAARRRKLKLAA